MDFKIKLMIVIIKLSGAFVMGTITVIAFAVVIDIASLTIGFEYAHQLSYKGRYLAYPCIPIIVIFYIYAKSVTKKYEHLL